MPSVKDCAHLKMKVNDLICVLGFLFNPISACHPKLINLYENWHEKTEAGKELVSPDLLF